MAQEAARLAREEAHRYVNILACAKEAERAQRRKADKQLIYLCRVFVFEVYREEPRQEVVCQEAERFAREEAHRYVNSLAED